MRTPFDTVLVVDFGAQYAQLIARRVREAHVYSEIVPFSMTAEEMLARSPKGIILSGGPKSVYADFAPQVDPAIYGAGVPVLGICYGAQLLNQQLGGTVGRTDTGEYGRTRLDVVGSSRLFEGRPPSSDVWMSHADSMVEAPPGFSVTASTDEVAVAALEDAERGIYGVQFHPEVAHTERGQELMKRFLFDVCQCRPNWTHTSVIESEVEAVRRQVGEGRVLCALSGGVDSAVAAALVHKAVGDQLKCVFVDTGLMRQGEAEQVEETFRRQFAVDLVHVKAADRFFDGLSGVTDPEQKRKIIGELFIRIFEEVARDLGAGGSGSDGGGSGDGATGSGDGPKFLVQGTLYPDVIESLSPRGGPSVTIKTHHNVGGLKPGMQFMLIEPLRELFKDEVRNVGRELGLPEEM
ncbi:MAG TPA: glutamine-hydrolyzing GMP synthase, partial [Acidimicrobiales bacterium]|nr:glutamine-hydrolyzing GMP synthase [Acidimicrobiales bacterium]